MHHNKPIQKALIILMVAAGLLLSQGFGTSDAKDKTEEEKKPERSDHDGGRISGRGGAGR